MEFEEFVKFIFREKHPKNGARLIQTTSTNFNSVKNLVQSILDENNIDTSKRKATGGVRIVFELGRNNNKKKDTIHVYGIKLSEVSNIVLSKINSLQPKLIHGNYSESDMNFWTKSKVDSILLSSKK